MGLIDQLTTGLGMPGLGQWVQVMINGADIGPAGYGALSSVTVKDSTGFVSDTAELLFASNGPVRFALPPNGVEVDIALGRAGSFRAVGRFLADEVEEAAPPHVIRATCRAKPQGESVSGWGPMQPERSQAWPAGTTIGAMVEEMAGRAGLRAAVTASAAGVVLEHVDQIAESDLAVLFRLAREKDLVAKPAGGALFVGVRGEGVNASGAALPSVRLTEPQVTRWMMRRALGDVVGSVTARYWDSEAGGVKTVTVGKGEPARVLPQTFANSSEANSIATTVAKRAGRAVEALEVSLPGDTNITAEGRVELVGFSGAADGVWVVDTVTHTVTAEAGFVSSLRCSRPPAAADAGNSPEDQNANG